MLSLLNRDLEPDFKYKKLYNTATKSEESLLLPLFESTSIQA